MTRSKSGTSLFYKEDRDALCRSFKENLKVRAVTSLTWRASVPS